MTNAEAIETLRANYPDACFEQLREAVDAAIEALKAQDAEGDTISRQAAIRTLEDGKYSTDYCKEHGIDHSINMEMVRILLNDLSSAQPEIIRCNSCKYWTQSMGEMKGYGLGRCDFHDADLVTCNGFCYWAERRNNECTN